MPEHKIVIALLLIPAAYALGCFTTGYYVKCLSGGTEVRTSYRAESSTVGTTRELSAWLFLLTFLIDFGKGALAVFIGRLFHLPSIWLAATMLAVVAGHIWPVQLNFRGGKGIATTLGTLLAFDYNILILLLLTAAVLHLTNKNLMLSGLSGMALTSAFAAMLGHIRTEVLGVTILVAVVLYAHRAEIKEILAEHGYFKRQSSR